MLFCVHTIIKTFKYLKLTKNNLNVRSLSSNISQLIQTFDTQAKNGHITPIHQRSLLYGNHIAIKDNIGEYRYIELYAGAKKFAQQLSNVCHGFGTNKKIAFLCTNSAVYILIQWACWIAGQIAVPLNPHHPNDLLKYFLSDCQACVLITVPEYEEKCANLSKSLNDLHTIVVDHNYLPTTVSPWKSYLTIENDFIRMTKNGSIYVNEQLDEEFYAKSNAMILYTSGSTGRPKGALITHRNLAAQAKCLTSSWYINDKDTLLHCAPLSHALGSIHTLACPLSVGSRLIMLPKFDAAQVWQTLLNENDTIDIFMAVPTMFKKLIDEYARTIATTTHKADFVRNYCREKIRLMVAGSAPLPQSIYDKWRKITGHHLLLRYGTTEIGMALSNSYVIDKVRQRSDQSVGRPMPGCQVKLVENGQTMVEMSGEYNKGWWSPTEMTVVKLNASDDMITGEIFIRGPNVFSEYYNRPDATKMSFDHENWFRTGDYAKYENGVFSILGRSSVDVIKTGGYKVSALEIETELLEHTDIIDVCIVGLSDDVWGQIVGALIVLKNVDKLNVIQEWCKLKLAVYQIPKRWIIVSEIKRNEMGKVNKVEVLKEYFDKN